MDSYETIKNLGGGGGGVANLVKDIESGELFVIKSMYNSEIFDVKKSIAAEKAMAECQNLDSAYLVKYFDFFQNEEEGTSNIVMEYCPGGDLTKVFHDNYKTKTPISYPVLKKIISESCVGLYVLHRAHIMHRDIKPENIFVLENNNVKIGDFGTGKKLENTAAKAATMIGTQEYEAPEVRAGKSYGFEADLYSLGLVFYELVTLSRKFENKPITRADIPQWLKEFIIQLTNADHLKRPTIRAIVQQAEIKEGILELPWATLPAELLQEYGLDAANDPKLKA